jgi:ParB family chromosome partitioning protein
MTHETRRGHGGLGRGLAALIPSSPTGVSGPREIELSRIRPNPRQPRRTFDPIELASLADSMVEHGVLQPVIVVETGDGFTLIAGERRCRAASQAGLHTIPAIVRDANEQERLTLALVENIQRSDLNAMDEARGLRQLIDEFGLTQEEAAQRVGRSRPAISNSLRLLELAPEVRAAIEDGSISGGHGRALAALDDAGQQRTLLAIVVSRSLSVRQTERLVAETRAPGPATRPARRSITDPDMQLLEARLREALGTRVAIRPGSRGGRITIDWYDHDDLDRLVERLSGRTEDGRHA